MHRLARKRLKKAVVSQAQSNQPSNIILGGPGSPIAIGPRHCPKLELTGDLEEEREEVIISQAWL